MKTLETPGELQLSAYYQNLKDVLKANIEKAIRGKDEVIEYLLIALISGGHVLIEDVPGVGKTTLENRIHAYMPTMEWVVRRWVWTRRNPL